MNQQSKKIIITGASSGIGKASAIRFAEEGWDICLNARREGLLHKVKSELNTGHHLVCPGTYSDPKVVESIYQTVVHEWGKVDVLLNNAGIFTAADVISTPIEEWRIPFDNMVNGAILMSRIAVKLMQEEGRIIHITSIHGERVERKASAYAMAKAAINHYSRSLALELADRHILVNAIAPGFVSTPMSLHDGIDELKSDWFKENYIDGHHLPLRRPAKPKEIAGVAYFLAGPDASYITGQVITVDGGLSITF